jgi:hypothetical protein
MTRTPVTLPDQGISIEPDDAGELIDLIASSHSRQDHLATQDRTHVPLK